MANDLKEQTKRFALEVVRFCSALPNKAEFRVNGGQLLRARASVGANCRTACRSKSKADFISKLAIVEEEAGQTEHWLELTGNLSSAHCTELVRLKSEASQRGGRTWFNSRKPHACRFEI